MRNYRVTGARRDDGSHVDEILHAASKEDAVTRANELGILVAGVEVVVDVGGPRYTRRRRRQMVRSQRERRVVRFIARFGALVLMAPGALVFVVTLFSALVGLAQTARRGGTQELLHALLYNTMGVFGAAAVAAVLMTSGALVLLALSMEESLFLIKMTKEEG